MHLINSVFPAPAIANTTEDEPPTVAADFYKTNTFTSVRDWRPGLWPRVAGSTWATAWIAGLLLTSVLSGCAEYRSYETCGEGGCPADASITASVQGLFAQHPELDGPDQLYVKTLDHVVYLSGTVETGLHRDIAASVAREVSGVTGVVNDIAIDK